MPEMWKFSSGEVVMEKVIKYKCDECGELFDTPEMALAHEIRHERIEKANEMLNEGCTLKQINDECEIWAYVPEHLENINKDNCFKISYWQCCDKPAYQIIRIYFDGYVNVRGCGSWSGYYGNRLRIDDSDLRNPRPKAELFVDPRYEDLYRF